MGKYPKQVVFTTTEHQFGRLRDAAVELHEHGISRADLLREALDDAAIARALKRLTPRRPRKRGES